jgi:hypothetical protein
MDRRASLSPTMLGHPTFSAAVLFFLFIGLQSNAQAPATGNPVHLSADWSHRHLVFSLPANYAQAWELQKEPRYFYQYVRQHTSPIIPAGVVQSSAESEPMEEVESGSQLDQADKDLESDPALGHRDWAVALPPGAFMGASQFPAKFSFDVNAAPSCTADYVAFTTSKPIPSIVAFDNLYSTQPGAGGFCNHAGPSVKWAYNTNLVGDNTGVTVTSPVISFDGSKIAYVESRTSANGGSILHILSWKPGAAATVQGTIAAPAKPDIVIPPGKPWNTTNCPAARSCIVNIIFNGTPPDTLSAPFYNYALDILYVGDDVGVLHKFTGVFLGSPAEVTTGGWPLRVHPGTVLTSPVFDFTSKNIFVGDNSGRLSFVKEVGSITGACAGGTPPCLGAQHQALTGSIVDAPIVDASTERVLVIDGTEISANHGSMFQFDAALTTASKITVRVGGNLNRATDILHAGTFDDAYFSVGPAAGHFYTCGKDPLFNNRPAIYRFSFDASGRLRTIGIPAPLTRLSSANLAGDACSPITELKNGATDRIFFSIASHANLPANGGTATGCTNGIACVSMIVLGAAWPPAATTAGIKAPFAPGAGVTGAGGSSGIVIDNVGTGAQESNIYYTYRVNSNAGAPCNGTVGVGCAVKATQSALK